MFCLQWYITYLLLIALGRLWVSARHIQIKRGGHPYTDSEMLSPHIQNKTSSVYTNEGTIRTLSLTRCSLRGGDLLNQCHDLNVELTQGIIIIVSLFPAAMDFSNSWVNWMRNKFNSGLRLLRQRSSSAALLSF